MSGLSSGRGMGWTLAIVGPAAAAGLGLLLAPILGPHVLILFLLAIAIASLVGGLGPGLFAVAASGVAANYWFFPPFQELGFTDQIDFVAQLVFWAIALLVATVCAWSRARRLRAEGEAEELNAEIRAMQVRLTASEPVPSDPRADTVRKEARAKPSRETSPQPTALVASDDTEARQVACHALESMGFRWLSACDATEALELVDRYDFPLELAVIDVLLPDTTGESLAEQLFVRHANTAVLYISNLPHDELVNRDLMPLRGPLLPQPCTADRLVSAVRDLIGDRVDNRGEEALVVSSGGR